MDALAANGVRFETAIVQNPVCVPSRISMKSGHYPHTFGVTAMGKPAAVEPAYMKEAHDVPNLLNAWKEIGIPPINIGKTHVYQRDWGYQKDVPVDFDATGQPRDEKIRARLKEAGSKYPEVVTKTHGWAIGGTVPLEPHEVTTGKLGDLALDTAQGTARQRRAFLSARLLPRPARALPGAAILFHRSRQESICRCRPRRSSKSKPRFEREQFRIYSGGLDLTREQIGIARGTYYGMVSLVDAQVGRLVELPEARPACSTTRSSRSTPTRAGNWANTGSGRSASCTMTTSRRR